MAISAAQDTISVWRLHESHSAFACGLCTGSASLCRSTREWKRAGKELCSMYLCVCVCVCVCVYTQAAAEAANGEGQNTGALNSLINKWSNGSVTGPTAAGMCQMTHTHTHTHTHTYKSALHKWSNGGVTGPTAAGTCHTRSNTHTQREEHAGTEAPELV